MNGIQQLLFPELMRPWEGPDAETLAARLKDLLNRSAPKSECEQCGAWTFRLIDIQTGCQVDYTAEGLPHHIECTEGRP